VAIGRPVGLVDRVGGERFVTHLLQQLAHGLEVRVEVLRPRDPSVQAGEGIAIEAGPCRGGEPAERIQIDVG
jgi:hypothetical protein